MAGAYPLDPPLDELEVEPFPLQEHDVCWKGLFLGRLKVALRARWGDVEGGTVRRVSLLCPTLKTFVHLSLSRDTGGKSTSGSV